MKSIDTLVQDINNFMLARPEIVEDAIHNLTYGLTKTIRRRFSPEEHARERKGLRASNIGTKCDRKLFYSHSEGNYEQEEMPASAHIKFMFGDILEELLFFLAEACGWYMSW